MKLYNLFFIMCLVFNSSFGFEDNKSCQTALYHCNTKDKLLCCEGLFCNEENSKSYYGYCDMKKPYKHNH